MWSCQTKDGAEICTEIIGHIFIILCINERHLKGAKSPSKIWEGNYNAEGLRSRERGLSYLSQGMLKKPGIGGVQISWQSYQT